MMAFSSSIAAQRTDNTSSVGSSTMLPPGKPSVITILRTTELTGVQVAIIIAAGIIIFLMLSILAQRQIQRMMFCKHLLTSAVPKLTEMPGVRKEVGLLLHERMLRSCDVDGHMFAWDEKFNRPFFREENPHHYWRAKAVDQCNRILPVLYSFGGRRYTWLPHECVDDFLLAHHGDFPYREIQNPTLEAFCQIYKKLRFGEGKFDESYYHHMRQIVDSIIDDLLRARQADELIGEDDDPFSHVSVLTVADAAQTSSSAARERATTLDSSAFSNMSSIAATNRTFADSKLNISEASGKALLLPRVIEHEGMLLTVAGAGDNNSLRDRRVSPLGYARLDPENMPRFPALNYYLNKARSFVRGGRLGLPPRADGLTDQMPLQISSAAAGGASRAAATTRSGRTGPAALLDEDVSSTLGGGRQWSSSMPQTPAPVIIRTPDPTRRTPIIDTARQKLVPIATKPKLVDIAQRRAPGTSSTTSSGTAQCGVSRGGDGGAGVHRRGIGRRRIFSAGRGGESLQIVADDGENLKEEGDEDEINDDGGKKDLLR